MIKSGFDLRQYREFYRIKQWELAAQLGFSSSVLCDIEKVGGHSQSTSGKRLRSSFVSSKHIVIVCQR